MIASLEGSRIAVLERPHRRGHEGAVADQVEPLLREAGAVVERIHAEAGLHRLDVRPRWNLVVLKSGSAAALHLAGVAEAWGIPCINSTAATRLAQDRLASVAILRRAGLPIADGRIGWLCADTDRERLRRLGNRSLVVKSARGSRGGGIWMVPPGELHSLVNRLPAGPYLMMERIPHERNDLKVFVAGSWLGAIDRIFPALTLAEKRGRPVRLPGEVADVACAAGRVLGLTCYGCDFVLGPSGWVLVDVNAFPGYKGADGAARALAEEIARAAAQPVAA